MHAELRCTEETLSTDLWTMEMDYDVWVYNRIPDVQSGLSAIEIWSRSVNNVSSGHLSAACINMVLDIVTTVLMARSAAPF